jgi:hypothetical protein
MREWYGTAINKKAGLLAKTRLGMECLEGAEFRQRITTADCDPNITPRLLKSGLTRQTIRVFQRRPAM